MRARANRGMHSHPCPISAQCHTFSARAARVRPTSRPTFWGQQFESKGAVFGRDQTGAIANSALRQKYTERSRKVGVRCPRNTETDDVTRVSEERVKCHSIRGKLGNLLPVSRKAEVTVPSSWSDHGLPMRQMKVQVALQHCIFYGTLLHNPFCSVPQRNNYIAVR